MMMMLNMHTLYSFNHALGGITTSTAPISLQWGAADAQIIVPSVENAELVDLPLKPGVGKYIVIRTTPTARDSFLANVYPSSPFTCIFSQNLPEFFLCRLWLKPVPVWALRIK